MNIFSYIDYACTACLNTFVQNQGLNSEFVLLLISRGDESHVSTTNVFFLATSMAKLALF